MEAMALRTFFAIDISKENKEQLADYNHAVKRNIEKHYKSKYFRWVKPDNMHVTLQFLARVNKTDLVQLIEQVRIAVSPITAFQLELGFLEWFPSTYRPHVLSLQLRPQEKLVELSTIIGQGIAKAGYAVENRAFRGHLTLGRVKLLKNLASEILKSFNLLPLPVLPVKEIVLFHSQSMLGESIYTPLAVIALGPVQ